MPGRDDRDIFGGGVLIAVGAFFALYTSASYNLGTFGKMGPGMFPMLLGLLLIGLGALVAVPALYRIRSTQDRSIKIRPLLAVLAAIVAFALLAERIGVAPAVIVLTLVSTLADDHWGPLGALILSALLGTFAITVFYVLLGVPFQLFRWPF